MTEEGKKGGDRRTENGEREGRSSILMWGGREEGILLWRGKEEAVLLGGEEVILRLG